MRRDQLISLMKASKEENGGSPNFLVVVPEDNVRAVATILRHFVAEGTISGWSVQGPANYIDIEGYNG